VSPQWREMPALRLERKSMRGVGSLSGDGNWEAVVRTGLALRCEDAVPAPWVSSFSRGSQEAHGTVITRTGGGDVSTRSSCFFPVWGRELRQKISQCDAGGQPAWALASG
jgi:hypothetical protein